MCRPLDPHPFCLFTPCLSQSRPNRESQSPGLRLGPSQTLGPRSAAPTPPSHPHSRLGGSQVGNVCGWLRTPRCQPWLFLQWVEDLPAWPGTWTSATPFSPDSPTQGPPEGSAQGCLGAPLRGGGSRSQLGQARLQKPGREVPKTIVCASPSSRFIYSPGRRTQSHRQSRGRTKVHTQAQGRDDPPPSEGEAPKPRHT